MGQSQLLSKRQLLSGMKDAILGNIIKYHTCLLNLNYSIVHIRGP
jgi:hypothetical protein